MTGGDAYHRSKARHGFAAPVRVDLSGCLHKRPALLMTRKIGPVAKCPSNLLSSCGPAALRPCGLRPGGAKALQLVADLPPFYASGKFEVLSTHEPGGWWRHDCSLFSWLLLEKCPNQ